jgi:hypothetical protein
LEKKAEHAPGAYGELPPEERRGLKASHAAHSKAVGDRDCLLTRGD